MSKNTTIWVLQTVKEHPQKGLELRLLSHFDERGKPRFTLSPLEAKWFRSRNHANTVLDLRLKHMGFIARCYQVDCYGRWNLVTRPTWRQQHGIN